MSICVRIRDSAGWEGGTADESRRIGTLFFLIGVVAMPRKHSRRLIAQHHTQNDRQKIWLDALESRVLLSISDATTLSAPNDWTHGNKGLLYIRATYSDTPTAAPQSLVEAQNN